MSAAMTSFPTRPALTPSQQHRQAFIPRCEKRTNLAIPRGVRLHAKRELAKTTSMLTDTHKRLDGARPAS